MHARSGAEPSDPLLHRRLTVRARRGTAVRLQRPTETYYADLKPGRNTITIVTESDHQATLTYGKHLKLAINVPGLQIHTLKEFWLDAGESYDVHVWVPPIVELSTSQ